MSNERQGARIARVPTITWVAVVAVLAAAAQLILLADRPLGWDETIYISQNANDLPSAFLSAPRSRGTSWLVWPLVHFTHDTVAINAYFSVLSAGVLILAFYPWTKILSKGVAVLASFLFAFLWVTIMFGSSAWPNYWLAVACLSATGWFIMAADSGSRWAAAWSGLSILVAAVFRFSDVAWLVLGLVACAITVPAWRRRFWLVGSIVAGFALGVAPWLVEAYLNFGGPQQRLDEASKIQGGTALNVNVLNVLRAAAGPDILCRPCNASVSRPYLLLLLVAAALVVLAVVVASRNADRRMILVPTVCAVALTIPYVFLLRYSAARFLLPTYALAVIPVAYALAWICRPSRIRPYAVALTALLLLANLGYQLRLVQAAADRQLRRGIGQMESVAEQITAHGVTPPCVIAGPGGPPLGFYTGCRSVALLGPNENVTRRELDELIARYPSATVQVDRGAGPPAFATGWQSFAVPMGNRTFVVYYVIPSG